MKFGAVALADARGAILAHGTAYHGGRLAKGTVLDEAHLALLAQSGITEIVVARLEPGDQTEDEAADALAKAIVLQNLRLSPASTGRVNIYATCNGLFRVEKALVGAFNRVDPAITFACLKDFSPVRAGDMVATIKIIPLAVSGEKVRAAGGIARHADILRVNAYRPHSVFLIQTELPTIKPSVLDKTARLMQRRLEASGSVIVSETRVPHSARAVASAIRHAATRIVAHEPAMIVLFGASAVCDEDDVLPMAMRLAGGEVDQVGLPVDPGNLLVLGHLAETPLVAAPGCARSPKENGFDWVLERLLAGHWPTSEELSGWGVGGLLMEIPSRPQPRELAVRSSADLSVGLMILAAGQARRMGNAGHKLLAEFDGVPLVRRAAKLALEVGSGPVVAVTGYRRDDIEAALKGLDLTLRHNEAFASGMASSIKTGLMAEKFEAVAGVMVLLADMPGLSVADLQTLVQAFRKAEGRAIVRASAGGKRGNPVILPRITFDELMRLEGDVGARHIIENSGLPVLDIEIGPGAYLDVDTPEAVVQAGGVLRG